MNQTGIGYSRRFDCHLFEATQPFQIHQTRVGYLTDSVGDARRSVELALVQYRQGSTNYQRVLDTQRFLVRQEDQLAGTKGDVALNLVATYKALGGGWDAEQSEGAQQ